jgi:HEXXH motif-containing protein
LPGVLEFVNAYTKVLVLQPHAEEPTLFSTGSSAQFVGRSVFGNPQLPQVDECLLAEGLVHEATHSLLYMNERLEPWISDPDLYGPDVQARSLWTGASLPLRSYLQACYVWYGLVQFWSQCLSAGAFSKERVRERLIQAAIGFLGEPILGQLAPYRNGISEALWQGIESMQTDVVEAATSGD